MRHGVKEGMVVTLHEESWNHLIERGRCEVRDTRIILKNLWRKRIVGTLVLGIQTRGEHLIGDAQRGDVRSLDWTEVNTKDTNHTMMNVTLGEKPCKDV